MTDEVDAVNKTKQNKKQKTKTKQKQNKTNKHSKRFFYYSGLLAFNFCW